MNKLKNITNITKEQLDKVIRKLNERGVIDAGTMCAALEIIRNSPVVSINKDNEK